MGWTIRLDGLSPLVQTLKMRHDRFGRAADIDRDCVGRRLERGELRVINDSIRVVAMVVWSISTGLDGRLNRATEQVLLISGLMGGASRLP